MFCVCARRARQCGQRLELATRVSLFRCLWALQGSDALLCGLVGSGAALAASRARDLWLRSLFFFFLCVFFAVVVAACTHRWTSAGLLRLLDAVAGFIPLLCSLSLSLSRARSLSRPRPRSYPCLFFLAFFARKKTECLLRQLRRVEEPLLLPLLPKPHKRLIPSLFNGLRLETTTSSMVRPGSFPSGSTLRFCYLLRSVQAGSRTLRCTGLTLAVLCFFHVSCNCRPERP